MDTDVLPLPQPIHSAYTPAGWHLVAWWMLAALCGLGLGLFTTGVIVFLGLQHFNLGIFLVAVLSGGAVVGSVQLQFLNAPRSTVSVHRWLSASIIGCSLAIGGAFMIVGVAQHIVIPSPTVVAILADYLLGPISGFILGASQWLVLRRTIQHAGMWILTIVVSSSIIWVVLLLVASYVFGGNGD